MPNTNTKGTRAAVATALRTIRTSAALVAGGVKVAYLPCHITVTGKTFALRTVLASFGFRYINYGNVREWRWTGTWAEQPAAGELYSALRRALVTA